MDSIKAQDIIRHIFKDEDKGVEYVTGLSITDGVEVLTKVLPELIKKAQEKNNVNDEGYFNEIGNVYRKIVVDKLLNADLAAAIGFSTKTVGRIERGDSTPSAEFMLRISKYFNLLVEDVFHEITANVVVMSIKRLLHIR